MARRCLEGAAAAFKEGYAGLATGAMFCSRLLLSSLSLPPSACTTPCASLITASDRSPDLRALPAQVVTVTLGGPALIDFFRCNADGSAGDKVVEV